MKDSTWSFHQFSSWWMQAQWKFHTIQQSLLKRRERGIHYWRDIWWTKTSSKRSSWRVATPGKNMRRLCRREAKLDWKGCHVPKVEYQRLLFHNVESHVRKDKVPADKEKGFGFWMKKAHVDHHVASHHKKVCPSTLVFWCPQEHCQWHLPYTVCEGVLSPPRAANSVLCPHCHACPNTNCTCGHLPQHKDVWCAITHATVRPLWASTFLQQQEISLVIWDHTFTDVQQWKNLTPEFQFSFGVFCHCSQ